MKRLILVFSAIAMLVQPAANLFAHAGHDKAPGDDNNGPLTGPIRLTAEAAKNLGLKVETADLRTIEKTLSALGHVEIDPARVAALASRISGRVTRLEVKDGDRVSKGDFLLEIESRQIGDPPPRIELKASLSGTVLERHIFTGDNVELETQLLKIVDLSSIYVVAAIYEGQIAQVKAGQKVRVRAEAFPEQIFEGTVEGNTAQLDPETRTLGVRVRVANPELHLLPNMRAALNIVTAEADSVVAVPLSAVLGEAGNYFVFVQDDKDPLTFVRTPVVVGQRDDRFVEMIEGVLPSASVVTVGNYQLQYVPPAAKTPSTDAHDKADAAKPAAEAKGH